jgi:hypothetical protein
MACNCGGNCNTVARRSAPSHYPAIVPGGLYDVAPGGLYDVTPGGKCPQFAQDLADNDAVRLTSFIVGGPAWHLLGAYCATGSNDASMRQAFKDAAAYHEIAGVVLGIAGLVPTPATPFLLVLGPLNLAIGQVLRALGNGRSPSASEVANVARAGAPALAAAGGDPTGGKAAEAAGEFEALAEFADETGAAPALLGTLVPPASSQAGRDTKKNALKRAKARAKKKALLKAKKSSQGRADDCRARGGVFDPTAPDGCRVGGGPRTKSPGKKGLALGAVGLALAKAFGVF